MPDHPPSASITPPPGPTLTPEQVWDKLFALVESLHSEADLTRASAEQAIGLPLYPRPGEKHSQYIAGDTTAGWRYIFDLLTYNERDIRVALKTFQGDRDGLGNAPTCTYPMEAVRKEMRRRGFKEMDLTAEGDRSFYWQFARQDLSLNAMYYFSGEDYDFTRTCLGGVNMAFTIPEYRETAK